MNTKEKKKEIKSRERKLQTRHYGQKEPFFSVVLERKKCRESQTNNL